MSTFYSTMGRCKACGTVKGMKHMTGCLTGQMDEYVRAMEWVIIRTRLYWGLSAMCAGVALGFLLGRII